MPEALIIQDQTWSGKAATDMRIRAVVGLDTVQKGVAQVIGDIRKAFTLPRIEITNFMQSRQAQPQSQGTVTVDNVVLTPLDQMCYYEFNPRDVEAHFYAEYLQGRLIDRQLPPNMAEFMMMQTTNRLSEFFENQYWRGRTAYASGTTPASKGDTADAAQYQFIDGFLKKFLNDPNTVPVPSPITLTSANIYAQITAGYNLVPHALLTKYGKLGLKLLVGYDTQRIYEDALTTAQFKNNDYTSKGINQYKGYDLVSLAGMPANTYLFSMANPEAMHNNLLIGMNSVEDNTLKIGPKNNTGELWFVKGLFKLDVTPVFTDQSVLYTPIIN
jgi:hypothetical protein